jgi:hypothetical protein
MNEYSPENDAKTIWLKQQTETNTLTAKLIEQRSRELRAKTQRKLFGTLAGPLVAGLFYAYSMKEFAALRQVLQPLFIAALAWSLAGLYFLNRGMWSSPMPGDAALSSGLEFCRRQIERQRDLVRRALLWSFGPVMLAIGTFVLALVMISKRERGIFPNGLPFLILVAVWVVWGFVIRSREQRQLQREIEELRRFESDNQN